MITETDYIIKSKIADLLWKLTNDSHLVSIINSWKAEMDSEWVLKQLKQIDVTAYKK